MTAAELIERLGLERHPEGGWYRETFREASSTAIFYLLQQGESSAWHRVHGASEVWHHYAGGPLRLSLAPPEGPASELVLGPDLLDGHAAQAVVPAGWWQAAAPLGDWALVGCTVAPAFEFAAFEMAPEGWSPPGSQSTMRSGGIA